MTTESQGWSGSCFMAASFSTPKKWWIGRQEMILRVWFCLALSTFLNGEISSSKWDTWRISMWRPIILNHTLNCSATDIFQSHEFCHWPKWTWPRQSVVLFLWIANSHDVQRDGNNASRGKRQVLLSTPKEDKVTWGVAEWRLLSTCFLAFGFMVFSLQMKLFSWGHVVSSGDHQGSKLQMLNFSGPRLFKGFYSVGAFFSGMARHNCENKSNCQNWAQEAALDENSARRR